MLHALIERNILDKHCKALYLHVLASNEPAIQFYEKNKFQRRKYLQNYYLFDEKWHDAFLYVLYVNNGKPPRFGYPFCQSISILICH